MHLFRLKIWQDIEVTKARLHKTYLLPAVSICSFATYSQDGRAVLLMAVFLMMLAAKDLPFHQASIILVILAFLYVILFWSHTKGFVII